MIPEAWMPAAKMSRVICHWTGGAYKANAIDKRSYHILVEGDGALVKGAPSIKLNEAPVKPGYAAHTRNCNANSIGVSMCAMGGRDVRRSPFVPGKWPLTRAQWDKSILVLADLCKTYSIPVTRQTVLTHAEVQGTLGIAQASKWDIAILAFDRSYNTATKVGDRMRSEVAKAMDTPGHIPDQGERVPDGLAGGLGSEKPRALLKKGSKGADVSALQTVLNENGANPPLVLDGDFGPKTDASVRAYQARTGLKADGVVGPLTWASLASAGNVEAPAPVVENKPATNSPEYAVKLFKTLGWSKIQAVVLTANLIWESGGNQDKPWTLRFEAVGDAGLSVGAGQWNQAFGRQKLLHDFAAKKGTTWKDGETQLLFLDHELHTSERAAGTLLKASTTLEEAMAAAIQAWRPGTPHTERRLAIAQTLMT